MLLGGTAGFAKIVFGSFVVFGYLHSIVYLAAKQPWRTIFFVLGGITTLVLLGDVVWLLVNGCMSQSG